MCVGFAKEGEGNCNCDACRTQIMELPKSAEGALSRAVKASTSARRLEASRDALERVFSNFDELVATLKATPAPTPATKFKVHGFRPGPDRKVPEIECDPVAFAFQLAESLDSRTLCVELLSWFSVCCMLCNNFEDFKDVIIHLSEWRTQSVSGLVFCWDRPLLRQRFNCRIRCLVACDTLQHQWDVEHC